MNLSYFEYLRHISINSTAIFSNIFLSVACLMIFDALPALGFQLDFSGTVTGNLTDTNLTDNIGATMRFEGVDPDNDIDLLIAVVNAYNPNNPQRNGTVLVNDGRINMPRNSSTTFNFSFVETGTNTPFSVFEADMGFYDIDGGNVDGSQERLTLLTSAEYTVTDASSLTIDTSNPQAVSFTSPAVAVTNPANSNNLTTAQENHAASFQFNNISEFEINYEVVGGVNTNNRNFFFAGDVVFTDPTDTVTFEPVPFEFSPSLGLLLSGCSLWVINYLRRLKIKMSDKEIS